MTPDYANIIEQLKLKQATLGDGRDRRSDNERGAWWTSRAEIQQCLSTLMNVEDDLRKPLAQLADAEERQAAWRQKESEIERAIAEAPDPDFCATASERDRALDQQRTLLQSLQLLHRGELLAAPGQAYGRREDLDRRVAELEQKVARLRAGHASCVQQAEALLGETVARV